MRRLLVLVAALLLTGAGSAQAASWTNVPLHTDVDYQLGGDRTVPAHVGIVERDRTSRPVRGRYNVCYINGFQTQPDALRWWRTHHWDLVLKQDGRPVGDTAWGEWLLDTRTAAKRQALARIVGGWIRGCDADGFDATELDNLDSFTRSRHLLTRSDAIAFARLLVARAHDAGLAVGQKNLAGYDGTRIGFDFAVAEECGRYRECGLYAASYGSRVLSIEYRATDFAWTCAHFGARWAVVLRDRDLTPTGVRRWC